MLAEFSEFPLGNTTSDFNGTIFPTGKLVNASFRAQWNTALASYYTVINSLSAISTPIGKRSIICYHCAWLTGLRQESCRREAADSARVFVSTVESDRRVHHDTAGSAAIHGQGRAEHRPTGAGNWDDDGPQETGRRSVDSRPYHWLPGRSLTTGSHLPACEQTYFLELHYNKKLSYCCDNGSYRSYCLQ